MRQVESNVRGYTDNAPIEYMEMIICREFGWTYDELEAQPADRIQQVMAFLSIEGKEQKRRNNKK